MINIPNPRLRRLTALLTAMALSSLNPVTAGALDSALDGMYYNATGPAAFNAQGRLALIGGSLVARTNTLSLTLIKFDEPRLSAGCNGINAYLGAFSFIDKDEIVQFMRKVAQNAKGLLFKLAIDTINQQLAGALSEFKNTIERLNGLFKNSCQIASYITAVDTDKPAKIDEYLKNVGSRLESLGSVKKDFFESLEDIGRSVGNVFKRKEDTTKSSATGTPANDTTTTRYRKEVGNVTWNAIQDKALYNEIGIFVCQVDPASASACKNESLKYEDKVALSYLIMNIAGGEILRGEITGNEKTIPETPPAGEQITGNKISVDTLMFPGSTKISTCDDLPRTDSGQINLGTNDCLKISPENLSGYFAGTDKYVEENVKNLLKYLNTSTPKNDRDALRPKITAFLGNTKLPLLSYAIRLQDQPAALEYMMAMMKPVVSREIAVDLAKKLHRGTLPLFEGKVGVSPHKDFNNNLMGFQANINSNANVTETMKVFKDANDLIKAFVDSRSVIVSTTNQRAMPAGRQ